MNLRYVKRDGKLVLQYEVREPIPEKESEHVYWEDVPTVEEEG